MNKYISNFLKYRSLLTELTVRDIKTRYRRSILGVLWSLLNPLCTMIVLSIVFSNLFKFNIEYYPLYILSGQVVFNFFSEATNMAMTSIIGSASLIKKAYIPKYLFVFSRIMSSVINVMASFAAFVVVMLFMRAPMHYTMIFSFIPLVFLVLLASGVGLILAAFAVKFRDLIHLYGVFITALLYLCPVIYSMSMLKGHAKVYAIVTWNPLTNIMVMFRDLALNGRIPSVGSFAIATIECAVILLVGFYAFYKKQDSFILNL